MNKIIGALWLREKNGKKYFSGVLNDLHGNINIAVFPNNKKQAENQPDFNIIISFPSKRAKTAEDEAEELEPRKNGNSDDDIAF